MGRLTGKVALITGASMGVGLGIARVFAREGANLVVTARREHKLAAVVPQLEELGAKVEVRIGSVAERASAEDAVKAAVDVFGQLDVLVNNAQSVLALGPVDEMTDEQIRVIMDSGFYGTLWHMLAALPHLKETKGSVINMGSRDGVLGYVGHSIYGAAKEAIRGLTRSLAREWGPHGIRVNTLLPSALSPAVKAYFRDHPDEREFYLKEIALYRFGDAEADVGPAALFLASDDSRYVTGQTLAADGGTVML